MSVASTRPSTALYSDPGRMTVKSEVVGSAPGVKKWRLYHGNSIVLYILTFGSCGVCQSNSINSTFHRVKIYILAKQENWRQGLKLLPALLPVAGYFSVGQIGFTMCLPHWQPILATSNSNICQTTKFNVKESE